ncbi:hypothetical protein [Streptomyces sp. NPDC007083]
MAGTRRGWWTVATGGRDQVGGVEYEKAGAVEVRSLTTVSR